MLIKKLFLTLLILLLVSVSVFADESGENVVAIVNGENISLNELDQYGDLNNMIRQLYQTNQEFTQLLLSTDSGKDLLNEYRKLILDNFIVYKLLKNEYENRNVVLSEDERNEIFTKQLEGIKSQNNINDEQLLDILKQQGINSIDEYKVQFFNQNDSLILINKLKEEVLSEVIIDYNLIVNYYEENKEFYKIPSQVMVRHILLETEDKAQEVLEKLNAGGDFIELAKEYSTGPSAEEGGYIGYISQGKNQVVAEFEEASFALGVNEISDVVKTKHGYHIIKVEEKKDERIADFDEVKDNIETNLLDNEKNKVWSQFIQDLRDRAEIEIKI
jgi:peptidyl-prolyl cis-trans isomerase C